MHHIFTGQCWPIYVTVVRNKILKPESKAGCPERWCQQNTHSTCLPLIGGWPHPTVGQHMLHASGKEWWGRWVDVNIDEKNLHSSNFLSWAREKSTLFPVPQQQSWGPEINVLNPWRVRQHLPAAVDHEGQCSPQTLGSSFLPRTLLPGQPDVAETRDSKEAPGGQTRISLCREPTPGQPSGRVFLWGCQP